MFKFVKALSLKLLLRILWIMAQIENTVVKFIVLARAKSAA